MPFEVIRKLGCEIVDAIRVHLYLPPSERFDDTDRRQGTFLSYTIDMSKNNILVLLTCCSISPILHDTLLKWVVTVDSRGIYERMVIELHESQSTEQLVLTLAALLCYRRLLPSPNASNNNSISPMEFDAFLNGRCTSNEEVVVMEHTAISAWRTIDIIGDDVEICQFLGALLDINQNVPDRFHDF